MSKKLVTDDPIYALHEYNLDVKNLALFLMGEEAYATGTAQDWLAEPGVEYIIANRFIRNLQILMHNGQEGKKRLPLTIHMKTCGGDWSEGMAIYDALKLCPNPTTVLSYTHARSMSSIILQAADKRVLMPHSYFMLHEGDVSTQGTWKQVHSDLKFFGSRCNDIMLNIYADKMKQRGQFNKWSRPKIKAMLQDHMNRKEDVFITAKEAVTWGLADIVFDGNWNKLNDSKYRK